MTPARRPWVLLALALALPAGAAQTPVPRKVLALYTQGQIPSAGKDTFFLPLHQHGELPLNHLGLDVVYRDAEAPLPDPATLTDYRGVLTWFNDPFSFKDPAPVCRWLEDAMAAGLRLAVLGTPGVFIRGPGGPTLPPDCARMMETLGVRFSRPRTTDALSVTVRHAEPGVLGFERRVDPSEAGAVPLVRALPGTQALLRLSLADGELSEPVAASPHGAIALDPFLLYANYAVEPQQFKWVTNPFAFFELAFAAQGLPRPDTTTLSGRRMYMSHIDGDGFFNRAETNRRLYAGEVFHREFLLRHSSSPFTVSFVTGYYDLAVFSDPATTALSREMMNLPNVEPAAHGYAHPLVWRTGALALKVPRYRMDARAEIEGSARTIDEMFLPSSRKTRLFLWTGDCLPSAEHLEVSERAQLLNMNGGGGRFDYRFPSYAYLFGLGRTQGGRRQVYSSSFNENEFTGLWSGPFYGYRDAVETFERTESPRRVKPVDVYIHFYSAEKYAALASLKKVYAWAHRQELVPVFSSRYVRTVLGFYEMRLLQEGPGRFRALGGADLRTLRFDDEPREPDLRASRGVVGWRRSGSSLYVALDESDDRLVVLAARPRPAPALEEANFEVFSWRLERGGVRFKRRGWWEGAFTLRGLEAGRRYRVASAGTALELAAGRDGRLRAVFPDSELGGHAREVAVEPLP